MDYFYERNIVEIKNEYTTFLVNIITPFIYEGIRSVYSFSINTDNEFLERGKHDPDIKSPGILKLFQLSLKEIPTLNNHAIEVEVNRIKSGSKCADWFDDLIKAVIKSNIVLLTFNNHKRVPDIVKEKYHDKIETKDFIHKCYIESARAVYNNPELFWHEYTPLEIKRNQREACDLIKQAVNEAIRKMLPIKLILNEYLSTDYQENNVLSEAKYMDIKSMVDRDLNDDYSGVPGRQPVPIKSALLSDDIGLINEFQEGGENYNDDNKETDYMLSSSSSASSSSNSYTSSDFSASSRSYSPYIEDNEDNGNYEENILESVKNQLENIEPEQKFEKLKLEPDLELKPDLKPDVIPEKKEENAVINIPENNIPGDVPKAENDNEVKELLKKANVIGSIDNIKKKRLSKKEKDMLNELQKNMKAKDPKEERKAFFEEYMK